MKVQDKTITVQTIDDKEMLVSKKQCKDLFNVFDSLKFML